MNFDLTSGEKFDWSGIDNFLANLRKDVDDKRVSIEDVPTKIRAHFESLHFKYDGVEVDWKKISPVELSKLGKNNPKLPNYRGVYDRLKRFDLVLEDLQYNPLKEFKKNIKCLRSDILQKLPVCLDTQTEEGDTNDSVQINLSVIQKMVYARKFRQFIEKLLKDSGYEKKVDWSNMSTSVWKEISRDYKYVPAHNFLYNSLQTIGLTFEDLQDNEISKLDRFVNVLRYKILKDRAKEFPHQSEDQETFALTISERDKYTKLVLRYLNNILVKYGIELGESMSRSRWLELTEQNKLLPSADTVSKYLKRLGLSLTDFKVDGNGKLRIFYEKNSALLTGKSSTNDQKIAIITEFLGSLLIQSGLQPGFQWTKMSEDIWRDLSKGREELLPTATCIYNQLNSIGLTFQDLESSGQQRFNRYIEGLRGEILTKRRAVYSRSDFIEPQEIQLTLLEKEEYAQKVRDFIDGLMIENDFASGVDWGTIDYKKWDLLSKDLSFLPLQGVLYNKLASIGLIFTDLENSVLLRFKRFINVLKDEILSIKSTQNPELDLSSNQKIELPIAEKEKYAKKIRKFLDNILIESGLESGADWSNMSIDSWNSFSDSGNVFFTYSTLRVHLLKLGLNFNDLYIKKI